MDYGAIDLHKKDSQIRIVTEGGEVLDRRIATTRDRLMARRPSSCSVVEPRRADSALLHVWAPPQMERNPRVNLVAERLISARLSTRFARKRRRDHGD